eukprot:4921173-Pyramimonas_sp.AAC.1
MVLAGLRLDSAPCTSDDSESVPPKVVSDSAAMADMVAENWGKIFERAPTAEQKQRLTEFLDRYDPQHPV